MPNISIDKDEELKVSKPAYASSDKENNLFWNKVVQPSTSHSTELHVDAKHP
jgi:hypothetical protein